jgi:hypothetical protein
MAAGTFTLYRANLDDLRMQDLTGATVKLALVSSAYTPDAANTGHDEWADVSANEIANGNGYTTGGETLTNDAVSTTTNGWKYDADDVPWTASGGNIPAWRYGVLYVSGALWGKTSPLIGHFLGDSTPADVPATSSGNTLTVAWNASGVFTLTQA